MKIKHNQSLEFKMTNNIEVKTITINNNEKMTDWKGNEISFYMKFDV